MSTVHPELLIISSPDRPPHSSRPPPSETTPSHGHLSLLKFATPGEPVGYAK